MYTIYDYMYTTIHITIYNIIRRELIYIARCTYIRLATLVISALLVVCKVRTSAVLSKQWFSAFVLNVTLGCWIKVKPCEILNLHWRKISPAVGVPCLFRTLPLYRDESASHFCSSMGFDSPPNFLLSKSTNWTCYTACQPHACLFHIDSKEFYSCNNTISDSVIGKPVFYCQTRFDFESYKAYSQVL